MRVKVASVAFLEAVDNGVGLGLDGEMRVTSVARLRCETP